MGLDLKKISVTLWIVLAGIIIYIGSLWQRPLFLFEYAEFEEAVNCLLKNSTPHYSSWLNIIPLKLFGLKAFSARLVPALLTLAAGIFIFLAGKKSNFPNAGKAGALIFLLSPAVFLAGTTSIHPMYAAAPAITGACSLFLLTGSRDRLNGILWGISGTISMCLLLVEGSVYLFILLLILQVVFAVLRRFVIEPENKNTLFSMLSFIPFVIAGLWGSRHAAA
ncbi:MAG: hypothetical protein IKA87_05020, partial [Lentisphaeria bacterium]|nr:hypothetical protein [Lentisphaeria bacterium]